MDDKARDIIFALAEWFAEGDSGITGSSQYDDTRTWREVVSAVADELASDGTH